MQDIYIQPEDAVKELIKRWKDKELENKVETFLDGDIPSSLRTKPHVILFRHIITPDDEARKLVEFSKKFNIDLFVFEFTKDKFVSYNFDKYTLLRMFIYLGERPNGQENVFKLKVSDMDAVDGKKIQSIKTLWGEPLVEFHHNILYKVFPEFEDKIFDLSDWLKNHGGKAKIYYEYFVSLLVRNCILLENFQYDGEEGDFTRDVFLPAFKNIEKKFNLKPLVVKLAPDDYENNPSWWYYRDYIKSIAEEYIVEFKTKKND
ncbi:MAG: hypothetical protein WCO12_00125 [bacterium]